jgi:hypothetical protein
VRYIIVLEYNACLFKSTRAKQLPTSAEPTQSRKKQQRSFDRSGDIMSVMRYGLVCGSMCSSVYACNHFLLTTRTF